jgi:hypothetical protein
MAEESVQDMTRAELRALIREVMLEVLSEFTENIDDPDNGLDFRPEIAERLRSFMRTKPQGQSAADVARELGLDV